MVLLAFFHTVMVYLIAHQSTSRHYYMTQVFVPHNWSDTIQGQHITSPIMSTDSWHVDDGTPKPKWVCENRVNSVHGDIAPCIFMVPVYRACAEREENKVVVSMLSPKLMNQTDALYDFRSLTYLHGAITSS